MTDQSEFILAGYKLLRVPHESPGNTLELIDDLRSHLERTLDELEKAQVWQRGTDAALKTCAADLQKWQQRAEQAAAEAAQWQEAAGQATVRAEQLEDRLEKTEARVRELERELADAKQERDELLEVRFP